MSQAWRCFLGLWALCSFAYISCMTVTLDGKTLMVDGQPFFIRGVLYSPASLGSSATQGWPWGDYFTWQFSDAWQRDFTLLNAMGANTIRITGWNNNEDHTDFLNRAHEAGLKVIITFNVNGASTPIREEWQRQNLLGTFKWQVSKYLNHPALLGWSFGTEWNSPWNGWLQTFNDVYGCQWYGGAWPWDPNGCLNRPLADNSGCASSISCIYNHMFSFLNSAALYAKQLMGDSHAHLVFASLTDADNIVDRLVHFESLAPLIDVWGVQVYRGKDFGTGNNDLLAQFQQIQKPVLIVEYGVDAYDDPCGASPSSPCYNRVDPAPAGFGENEDMQSEWILALVNLIEDAATTNMNAHHIAISNGMNSQSPSSAALGTSAGAPRAGSVIGGILSEWVDNWWRAGAGVRGCWGPIAFGYVGFDPSQCESKAHVDCPNSDPWYHSLCGYPTPATFDGYANVGWFGIMKAQHVDGDVDRLTPRLVFGALRDRWRGGPSYFWLFLSVLCICIAITAVVIIYYRYKEKQLQRQRQQREERMALLMDYNRRQIHQQEHNHNRQDVDSDYQSMGMRNTAAAGASGVSALVIQERDEDNKHIQTRPASETPSKLSATSSTPAAASAAPTSIWARLTENTNAPVTTAKTPSPTH